MARVNLGKDTSGRPLVLDDTFVAKLRVAESALDFTFTIVQGSWRGDSGAAASANTHRKGGVGDFRTWNLPSRIPPSKAVLELRKAGLIAWYRTKAQGFDPHIHAIDYGNPDLDPSAQRQVVAWENGRNGLANNGRDDGPRVKIPKTVPKVAPVAGPFRIDGVDISHWQTGRLDFTAAKKAGVRWVYHKCTESTGFLDDRYDDRRIEVEAAGLPFGAYHFARPAKSGGKAQAQFFLDRADVRTGDMRPMLDLEDRGGKGKPALTDWVGGFVTACLEATGARPFIYTPFDLDEDFDCPLWTARYSNSNAAPRIPAPWKTNTVHQFSNGVFGVPKAVQGLGNVDLNTMLGDPVELTRKFTLGASDAPAQEVDMPLSEADINRIADRVLNAPLITNRNPDGKEAKTSLAAMLTNIEVGGDRVENYTKPTAPEQPPK